jgi:ABC-2 type transport system ATP-binding protein
MTTTRPSSAAAVAPARRGVPVLAELRSASKTYGRGGKAVAAVRDLDLAVRPGELLAVLGPNGAGKSTAIGMLTGLTAPTTGAALLFGQDPRDLAARQRIGVMLQASGVPETLRVRELLAAFRGYYADPLPVGTVVAAAGLGGLENRLFGALSGGQQRRVLFGLALCGNPELLFFDEPTTGLDPEIRRTLWATLRELAGAGRGVVLTTHYLEEADVLADRVVVLDSGRIIADGTPSEIKSLVQGRRITARTGVHVDEARGWPDVHSASRDGEWLTLLVGAPEPALGALLSRDPQASGLTVTETSLEEAFLTLTSTLTDRTERAA